MPEVAEKKCCIKCNKILPIKNYYKMNHPTEEYPDSLLPICKGCLENVYRATEPATFMPILKVLDIPWLPSEYKNLYYKNVTPTKPNNLAILGKYIMKMKLVQYRDYSFMDSDEAQKKFEDDVYLDSIENYYYDIPLESLSPLLTKKHRTEEELFEDKAGPEPDTASLLEMDDESNPTSLLTKEELTYLVNHWSKKYNPEQLLNLEKKYQEMSGDFDIRNASQKDYLKKMCVVSLFYDEALMNLDFESANKLSRMYTNITKEAGFQPIQHKVGEDNFMNSTAYLVKLAESEAPIPVYDIKENPDLVDATINDFKRWQLNLMQDDESIVERLLISQKELEEQDELLHTQDFGEEEGEEGYGIDMSDFTDIDTDIASIEGVL